MRNHSCPLANCCPSYSRDNCQGCEKFRSNPYKTTNPIVEKFKKLAEEKINLDIERALDIERTLGTRKTKKESSMQIKNVVFNNPATIVFWGDGTKTVVKCQKGDPYSKESGLAIAIAKKALGNKGNFNEVFKKWIPEYGKEVCDNEEEGTK